jgi:ADP-ribose pyrophosphatase YjhB (NUDIX family)
MNETHVVTVFLIHQGKVALVRRSNKVGTYKGCFSGISGYLEGDPDEHFRTELKEETALEPRDYILLKKGNTIKVIDENLGKAWVVHPYLCEVKDPSKIKLDWENTELIWIEPHKMADFNTVPSLKKAFDEVFIAGSGDVSAPKTMC